MSRDIPARPAPLLGPVDPQSVTMPDAEPVYDDWLEANERRLLAEADRLNLRQRAEAEAQDAAELSPPATAPRRDPPSGWWLLPAAAFGLLFWALILGLIGRLF